MLLVQTKVDISKIPNAGKGLFLGQPVEQGTIVCRFDPQTDRLFTEDQIGELPKDRQDYIRSHGRYSEEKGVWAVDGDDFQYVNHSDKPTLRGKGGPLGEFVAAFDLPAGAELTLYYPEICDKSRETGLIDTSKVV